MYATSGSTRRRIALGGAAAALLLALTPTPAHAQDALLKDGLFVTIPTPITSEVVSRVKASVERAVQHKTRPVRTVVFDFNPPGKDSGKPTDAETRDFGVCYELAKFIHDKLSLNGVFTVAYIRAKVSGHAVLPALACSELVMAPEGKIGEVVGPNSRSRPRTRANTTPSGQVRAVVPSCSRCSTRMSNSSTP